MRSEASPAVDRKAEEPSVERVKRRRALSHVGGSTETAGDRETAEMLVKALDVSAAPAPTGSRRLASQQAPESAADDPDRAHVHGFHTYPARMHPETAARLVRALSAPGATLLDPFCGSGTVLVEARIGGRRAIGVDLNPLAVLLSQVKTAPADARRREAIVAAARAVADFADARRERRAGATRRYPPDDVASFDPHVLLELDSLRAGILDLVREDAFLRDSLGLVLSSVLVKVSRRTSDTSAGATPRRIAAGFPARLFAGRASELARRMGALEALLPADAPPARVSLDDAKRLKTVGAATVDLVVTSPPYAGTYDYTAHHALRIRWLDLDANLLVRGEMGSRRFYAPLEPRAARQAWAGEIGAFLRALSRVCRKGARVALVAGDTAIRNEALRADAAFAAAAPGAGFSLVARASQLRPHFHVPTAAAFRDAPRAEHAIVLEKR